MGVHEKPDLPATFHKRSTRGFGGESGALTSPRKKLNLGLAEMQFPTILSWGAYRYLYSS